MDDKREVVNLKSVSQHRLDVLGMVVMTVTLGSYTARVPFAVVRSLGADILLGFTYIDRHIEAIQPRNTIVLNLLME